MLRDQALQLLGAPLTLKAWTSRNGIYLGRLLEITKDKPWRAVLEVTGVIKAAAHAEMGMVRRRGYRLGEKINIGGSSLMRPTEEELQHVGRSYFMTLLYELRYHQMRLIDPATSTGRYDISSEQVIGLTSVIEAELPNEALLIEHQQLIQGAGPGESSALFPELPAWKPAGMITSRNRLQRARCVIANAVLEAFTGVKVAATHSNLRQQDEPPEDQARYTMRPDGWENHPGDVLFSRPDPRSPDQQFFILFRESSTAIESVVSLGQRIAPEELPEPLHPGSAIPPELRAWQAWAEEGRIEAALPDVQTSILNHLATYYGQPLSHEEAQANQAAMEQEASDSAHGTLYEGAAAALRERARPRYA